MRADGRIRLGLRVAAIAIAVAAVLDPAVPRVRPDRAVVAVSARPADSALARRVRAALQGAFDVVAGSYANAAAHVVAGSALPAGWEEFRGPAFAVDDIGRAAVDIERVEAPRRAMTGGIARVDVLLRARAARGRDLEVTLLANELVVDRARAVVPGDDDRVRVVLAAPVVAEGSVLLRARATLVGGPDSPAEAATVVAGDRARARIHFFDAHPSWKSTFVRRAAERDGRLTVTSRVMTSVAVSVATRGAPPRLDAAALREAVDVLVVGAANALDERDVRALDEFLRSRGGTVVLLPDSPDPGPWTRLAAHGPLRAHDPARAVRVRAAVALGADSMAMRATELALPDGLPADAEFLAITDVREAPAVWAIAVGAGRLVVSGALDAWRYRDAAQSAFDRFWPDLLAHEAERAVPAVDVRIEPSVARPGARVALVATLRDAAFGAAASPEATQRAVVEASVHDPGGRSVALRVVPDGVPGRLVGEFLAPSVAGGYVVAVRTGRAADSAALVVHDVATPPVGASGDAVRAWVESRGGRVLRGNELGALSRAVALAVQPAPRLVVSHPMRSAWWILPFAFCLAGEWFLRRRRGLA